MNVEQKAGETQGSGQIDSISHPEATIPKNTVSNWNIRLHARIVSTFDVGTVISHGGSKVYVAVHNTHVQTTRSVNLLTVSNNFGFQFFLDLHACFLVMLYVCCFLARKILSRGERYSVHSKGDIGGKNVGTLQASV